MVKVSHVIFGIVIVLVVLVGVLFVFGDEVLRTIDSMVSSESSPHREDIVKVEEDGGTRDVGGTEGVESSSINGGYFGEIGGSDCKMRQIQYSLRNFEDSVECTDSGVNGCIRIVVSCSVEVYSFEKGVGIFGIRYSLFDSEDIELESELIEKEVEFGIPVIFSTEFVRSDMSGVDEGLSCPFIMETVPRKEVCN